MNHCHYLSLYLAAFIPYNTNHCCSLSLYLAAFILFLHLYPFFQIMFFFGGGRVSAPVADECSDVSEKHTLFIVRWLNLVHVGAEVVAKKRIFWLHKKVGRNHERIDTSHGNLTTNFIRAIPPLFHQFPSTSRIIYINNFKSLRLEIIPVSK